jgi:hypothetical protein
MTRAIKRPTVRAEACRETLAASKMALEAERRCGSARNPSHLTNVCRCPFQRRLGAELESSGELAMIVIASHAFGTLRKNRFEIYEEVCKSRATANANVHFRAPSTRFV